MPLRIRFQHNSGARLGFSIERLADGYYLDQSDMTFKLSPITPIGNLTESSSPYSGTYKTTLTNTPVTQFSNGNYAICVHNLEFNNSVLGLMRTQMISGDDNSVVTGGGGSGTSVDINAVAKGVWDYSVSGATTTGSIGKLVRDNIDVAISTRSTFAGGPVQSVTNPVTVGINQDKTGYSLTSGNIESISASVSKTLLDFPTSSIVVSGSIGKLLKDNIDVAISTRSTFAGGPVQSVTNPVTVGINQDKSGYSLASAGLDSISIESGINLRQAISPILAATAGVISGAGSGQIQIRGGNSTLTRILATTDALGNRTSVTLNIPS
jgi:hypothetical protein